MIFLKIFLRQDKGTTAIEYALVGTLVAIAIVGALTLIGTKLSSVFTTVTTYL